MGTTNFEEILDCLVESLRGASLNHYSRLPRATKESYEALSAEMKNRFGTRRDALSARWELQVIQQGEDETLQEFGARCSQLAEEGYAEGAGKLAMDLAAIDAFSRGTRD